MENGTVVVVTNEHKGLFWMMYKGSLLALETGSALQIILTQPQGTPDENAMWLEYAYRCSRYFEADFNAYCDEAARDEALSEMNSPGIRWVVVDGDSEFVRRIHRLMPGAPVMSKHRTDKKKGAALSAGI